MISVIRGSQQFVTAGAIAAGNRINESQRFNRSNTRSERKG